MKTYFQGIISNISMGGGEFQHPPSLGERVKFKTYTDSSNNVQCSSFFFIKAPFSSFFLETNKAKLLGS